jgi:hypothetical protein
MVLYRDKVAVQPSSHSCPMERSGWEASPGKMWAWQAAGEKPGRARVAMWLERRTAPFGTRTARLGLAGCLLVWGQLSVM